MINQIRNFLIHTENTYYKIVLPIKSCKFSKTV